MKTFEISDAPCIALSHEEGSHIEYDRQLFAHDWPDSIASLFLAAGGEVLDGHTEYAFDVSLNRASYEEVCGREGVEEEERNVERYRQRTGRKFPPVYRATIRVELEEVSVEETEAFWLARGSK